MSAREPAVIERFEGDQAILLVGGAEREVIVAADVLPSGARAGTWLSVVLEGEAVVHAEVDAVETETARARIENKQRRLQRRGRSPGATRGKPEYE